MKSLFLVLAFFSFISCNIVKTLTSGETNVDDNFNSHTGGSNGTTSTREKNLIFFTCNYGPCVLNTYDDTITEIATPIEGGTLSAASGYTYFDGHVFFKAYRDLGTITALFKYSLSTGEVSLVDLNGGGSSFPKSLTRWTSYLFMFAENTNSPTGGICRINSATSFDCGATTYPTNSSYYLRSVSYSSGTRLYACIDSMGGDLVEILDPVGTGFSYTSLVGVVCSTSPTPQGYTSFDSKFLYDFENGGANLYRVNAEDNSFENATPAASPTSVGMTYSGEFFYQDGSILYYIGETDALNAGPIVLTDGSYAPSNPKVIASPESFLFTDDDSAGNDQVYEVSRLGGNALPITNFTAGETILNFEGMPGGLYVFLSGSILVFSETDQNYKTLNVPGGAVGTDDFVIIREEEMNY